MLFRLRYQIQGGHTHIRLFAGRSEAALGCAGTFVLRNEEFQQLHKDLTYAGGSRFSGKYEFIEEGEPPTYNYNGDPV